jgi:DNA-binding IclR family transcriptional regulator
LTLDELAKLTHYPPASIFAQLRHLRKPRLVHRLHSSSTNLCEG